jgi:hypothetical protein
MDSSSSDQPKSFLHRGRRVTITHWTDGGKIHARAEIHQGPTLVCVLTRSGTVERAHMLLSGLHAAAVKWAEHHAAVSKRPAQWTPRMAASRPAPR